MSSLAASSLSHRSSPARGRRGPGGADGAGGGEDASGAGPAATEPASSSLPSLLGPWPEGAAPSGVAPDCPAAGSSLNSSLLNSSLYLSAEADVRRTLADFTAMATAEPPAGLPPAPRPPARGGKPPPPSFAQRLAAPLPAGSPPAQEVLGRSLLASSHALVRPSSTSGPPADAARPTDRGAAGGAVSESSINCISANGASSGAGAAAAAGAAHGGGETKARSARPDWPLGSEPRLFTPPAREQAARPDSSPPNESPRRVSFLL